MATVLTGERRIVSVLFADVVNSTGISEQIGPERSKFLMDEVLRVMTEQVVRYDGTVAQRIGDEIFAVFGAPVAHEDDSERAVLAGLAIQDAVTRYAEDVKSAYGVDLAVRVGVHTGPVVIPPPSDGDVAERWNALGDLIPEMLTTVTFVARVRLSDGTQWSYDEGKLLAALARLKLEARLGDSRVLEAGRPE